MTKLTLDELELLLMVIERLAHSALKAKDEVMTLSCKMLADKLSIMAGEAKRDGS
jgi:hypothetical protein